MTAATDAAMPAAMAELVAMFNSASVVLGIDVGHRTGLFEAMASAGTTTSGDLATAAGLAERPVREWLGLMTVGGIVEHDATADTFTLPPMVAAILTGPGMNLAAFAAEITINATSVPLVVRSMHDGRGIAYDELPHFTARMAEISRRLYDDALLPGYLGVVPGLLDRLSDGASVADLGCGCGHVANLIARAFHASSVVGFDFSEEAITAARKEAAEWGLTNATFELRDIAHLHPDARFDVMLAFDAIHDQARPRAVLAEARRVLADDGLFVMVDPAVSARLDETAQHPMAAYIYGCSLFHCLQVSLAQGGEALGTAYGHQTAVALLHEAGFAEVELLQPAAMDAFNGIFVARGRR